MRLVIGCPNWRYVSVSLCYLKINLMWLTTRVACHNIYMYKSHPLGTPPLPMLIT